MLHYYLRFCDDAFASQPECLSREIGKMRHSARADTNYLQGSNASAASECNYAGVSLSSASSSSFHDEKPEKNETMEWNRDKVQPV